ncbi:hypothetical protein LXL04_021116 [Taraxacum kok-saghyz]
MIKASLLRNELNTSFRLYKRLLENGMHPDNYTLPYILKACAYMESFRLGELVHGHCLQLGFLFDSFVGNTLIMMYSLFGNMENARYVFDEMPTHCVISWTVLISGYAKIGDIDLARVTFDEAPVKDRGIWGSIISGYVQNNCFKEGLHMFRLMQSTNIIPDEAILVSILGACAHLGTLEIGIWIHKQLNAIKLRSSVKLTTALMDMYCKCGKLDLALKLFDEMPERDTISWNVMISGLAIHGEGQHALRLFSQMETTNIPPDDVTFIAIFTACIHSGMEHEGLNFFNKMFTKYKINPKTEHFICIIDLLSRAGLFQEAKDIINKIPQSCSPKEVAVAWRAFLSACQSHKQIDFAKMAAERLMELENDSGVYVIMSNLYSSTSDVDSLQETRKMMRNRGVDKIPGCSLIEVGGVVNEFVAGEKTNYRIEEIHVVLENLNRQMD